MEIIAVVLLALGWISSVSAVAISLHTRYVIESRAKEIEADRTLAIAALEKRTEKNIHEACVELRTVAQQDAFDVLQNAQYQNRPANDPSGLGGFGQL